MPGLNMFDMHALPLPDAFTRGQIFAFSGIAGENARERDWCGILTGKPGEIRFCSGQASARPILLRFTESTPDYDVAVPDLIAARGGTILVTFADAQTIVGRSDTLPAVRLETEDYVPGSRMISDGEFAFSLFSKQTDAGFVFALCRRADAETAETDARNALALDADALAGAVLEWYRACPPCPEPGFEKLWYKCISVNRVNVNSPQDGFAHSFSTSDRLRRDTGITDSCFHATATALYAPSLAKDCLLSILDRQCADGSVSYSAKPNGTISDAAYLPVLCMTVWNLFDITGDTDFLRQTADPLRRYLLWNLENRISPNGLMTRQLSRSGTQSAAGETPQSNPLDALDLSVFMANDLLCLHRIYTVFGDHSSALQMDGMHRAMVDRINARLWDRQTQCYYDRTWGGAFRRMPTSASFLPLFAGFCDPRQAHCLIGHLTPQLELPFPIPSAADELDDRFPDSLQRGDVRTDFNFFVYVGLQRYGFGKLAAVLRQKTLEGARRLLRETGIIPELYDSQGGNPMCAGSPDLLSGSPDDLCAADFNTSACFIELLLRG